MTMCAEDDLHEIWSNQLGVFFNQFGAFLRTQVVRTRWAKSGVQILGPSCSPSHVSAASMGKKIRGKKRAQPDAADVATPAPK